MQNDSKDTQALDIDERRREIALFRYGVIADLVHLEPHHRGLYALHEKKSEQDFTIPGSLRRYVAPETMRGGKGGGVRGGRWVSRRETAAGGMETPAREAGDGACQCPPVRRRSRWSARGPAPLHRSINVPGLHVSWALE